MKLASYVVIVLIILFECSSGSNLVSQCCREATKNNSKLRYDLCVASLTDASSKSEPPPTNLEGLVGLSIQLTKSNGTNMLSIISELMNKKRFNEYAKGCLRDCFDLYSDSLSSLDDAVVAFKSKDFDTANIKVSAALDCPVTCEDQFKDKKAQTSPLTKENSIYFQLNVMSLAFIQMFRHHY